MTVFVPHYSQYGEKPAVSTAVGVGSKGIGFPLEFSGKHMSAGEITRTRFIFLRADSLRARRLSAPADEVFP